MRHMFLGTGPDDAAGSPDSPLERMLETADRHLENFASLVQPAPESKPRTMSSSSVRAVSIRMPAVQPASRS